MNDGLYAPKSDTRTSESTEDLLCRAREISWRRFGKKVIFYLPGMFRCGDERGRYPAISITGSRCQLQCDHCNATILEPMIHAETPEDLVQKCLMVHRRGDIGCLVTGGSDDAGRLPWDRFIDAIKEVKGQTDLKISVHSGLIDVGTAQRLKEAGVDQALIDVIGDDDTLRQVYHLPFGTEAIEESLAALSDAGLEVVPHIVAGLHYGEIRGEYRAIEMIAERPPSTMVIVVLMSLRNTSMHTAQPPDPDEVARIFATARIRMPDTLISLGCARPRNAYGFRIDERAIDAGVNRIAVQSDPAIRRAEMYGLETVFKYTCCSVDA